jgi:hypothetical protein
MKTSSILKQLSVNYVYIKLVWRKSVMKEKITKVKITEENNEFATVLIERLVERLLVKQLDLSIPLQAIVLRKSIKGKGDINEKSN